MKTKYNRRTVSAVPVLLALNHLGLEAATPESDLFLRFENTFRHEKFFSARSYLGKLDSKVLDATAKKNLSVPYEPIPDEQARMVATTHISSLN